jgi:putative spermidine/putrescine transport system permease protein
MFSGIRDNISPTIAAGATVLIVLATLMLLVLERMRRNNERLRTAKPT